MLLVEEDGRGVGTPCPVKLEHNSAFWGVIEGGEEGQMPLVLPWLLRLSDKWQSALVLLVGNT